MRTRTIKATFGKGLEDFSGLYKIRGLNIEEVEKIKFIGIDYDIDMSDKENPRTDIKEFDESKRTIYKLKSCLLEAPFYEGVEELSETKKHEIIRNLPGIVGSALLKEIDKFSFLGSIVKMKYID